MRLRQKLRHSAIVFCWLLLLALPTLRGLAQDSGSAKIAAPATGSTLFGVVQIVGTASSPTLQSYRLEYLSLIEANAQWQPIGKPVSQQVVNNVLGQWDTTALPEGGYQLRLRLTLRNGDVLEDYARDLKVSNRQPTALPTIPPPPTATFLPTAGPSPSPRIQQPPSATARAVVVAVSTPNTPGSGIGTITDSVPSALCGGLIIALIGFLLYGVAGVARERIRQLPVNRNG